MPEFSDILPAAAELAAKRSALAQGIAALFQPAAAAGPLAEQTEQVERLAGRFEAIQALSGYGYDQLSDFRARLETRAAGLKRLSSGAMRALDWLEEAQGVWEGERRRWDAWASSLPVQIRSEAVQNAFREASRSIERALEDIALASKPLLEFQGRVSDLNARLQALDRETGTLLRTLRERFLQKSDPLLFSPGYFRQLQEEGVAQFITNVRALQLPGAASLQQHGWVALLYFLCSLGLGAALHRKRRVLETSPRWRFVGQYPVATAFLTTTVLLSLAWGYIPVGWRAALFVAGGAAGARMLPGVLEDAWRRRVVFCLIALTLLTAVLRALGLPTALFRLYTLLLVAAGLPLCVWRGRVNAREGLPWWRVRIYDVWAFVLGVVGVANLAGYSALSRHVLVASLSTTMAWLIVWVLSLFVHGAVHYALSELSPVGRWGLVQRNARRIRNRADAAVKTVAALLCLGIVLQIWRAYASVGAAFAGLLSFGVTIGSYRVTLGLLLGAAMALWGALLVSWTLQDVLMHEVYPRRNVQRGVRFSMNRLLHYTLVLIGFVVALGVLGVNLQNITILAGALGVGIGFGLQAIVNNFVSGLILLFERPVKVGDIIQLGEQWGTISSIGLRATVVETFDKSEIIVPNSDLVSTQVTNWTLGSRSSRVVIPVGIAYGSDVPLAMKILRDVADANALVLEDPEPQVLFHLFGASSLDFVLRVWVADVDNRLVVRSELHQEIDRRFREAHVEIAFPQRDLHLRSVDERARKSLASVAAAAPAMPAETQPG